MAPDPTTLPGLLDDLSAEHADLEGLLEPLDEPSWGTLTPAEGWAVRDQVSHLAFFDDAATMAILDPTAFIAVAEAAMAAVGDPMEEHLRPGTRPGGPRRAGVVAGRSTGHGRARLVGSTLGIGSHGSALPWGRCRSSRRVSWRRGLMARTWPTPWASFACRRRDCATSPTSGCGPDRSPTSCAVSTSPPSRCTSS